MSRVQWIKRKRRFSDRDEIVITEKSGTRTPRHQSFFLFPPRRKIIINSCSSVDIKCCVYLSGRKTCGTRKITGEGKPATRSSSWCRVQKPREKDRKIWLRKAGDEQDRKSAGDNSFLDVPIERFIDFVHNFTALIVNLRSHFLSSARAMNSFPRAESLRVCWTRNHRVVSHLSTPPTVVNLFIVSTAIHLAAWKHPPHGRFIWKRSPPDRLRDFVCGFVSR